MLDWYLFDYIIYFAICWVAEVEFLPGLIGALLLFGIICVINLIMG